MNMQFSDSWVQGRVGRHRAAGFTLVEMLVAMAVTLILIFALSQAFAIVGESVSQGRATIELMGRLRTSANQLQEDLAGVTVPVRPWIDDAAGLGYFEIMEGVGHDRNPLPTLPMTPIVGQRTVPDMYGDIDDILAFTARVDQGSFIGVQAVYDTATTSWNYLTQQSSTAEIVYFTRFEDRDGDGIPGLGELTLHRRVFLIRPDLGTLKTGITAATALTELMDFQSRSDISGRLQASGTGYVIVANSLADLTRRESRFGHWPGGATPFPYPFRRALLLPKGSIWSADPATATQRGWPGTDDDLNGTADDLSELGWFGSDDRLDYTTIAVGIGEDVMLSDLLAFDVQVFDPKARVRRLDTLAGDALIPDDRGWWDTNAVTIGQGAFVNLNYANRIDPANANTEWNDSNPLGHTDRWSHFSGPPAYRMVSGNVRYLGVPVLWTFGTGYCTWSMHYERNGVDEDGDGLIDEGTNGFDDDNANGVDDVGERETCPPYPVPLRGLQVKLRVWDPDSRQVRQVSVVSNFVPE
jgi:prepilin-type N-terminal cleavage/methylation domain-containing protein